MEQASVGQVVDGGEQLLACEVAGDAEDDEATGRRDAREPAVFGVAQGGDVAGHESSSIRSGDEAVAPDACWEVGPDPYDLENRAADALLARQQPLLDFL